MKRLALALALSSAVAHQAADDMFGGSGYPAAEGSVVNYTYNNFGGFYLAVEDHTIRWEGFHGYFLGLVSANAPQISEVAPNVFHFSWRTRGTGSDNVVHNYDTMSVTAHLQPDQGAGGAIQMIHGVVHCRNTTDCIAPSKDLTPRPEIGPRMAKTISEFGLAPLFDPTVNNTPRALADIEARRELAGLAIIYDTPEGEYRVTVDDDTTRVSIANRSPTDYQTYASKLADDLFFVSWMGGIGGNHVVINTTTRKVYDHILPSGERRESIFELRCFDSADRC